jgi:LacI family transcriptional regulator
VSRVINNRPDVAPETRLRVQRTISRMGYRPNAIARSLIHRRSHTLGVVTTKLDYFGPSRTLIGIEKESRALGYSLLLDLLHHPEEDVEELLNRLLSRQVDGLIWAIPEIGSNRSWLQNRRLQIPVPVIYLSMQTRPDLLVASIDNRHGGFLATQHLLDQGYRQNGIITGPLEWWEARERLTGWEAATAANGIIGEAGQIVEGDWSATSGEQGILRLLEQYPQLEAVFACNDQMALGVLQGAHRSGRRVPEDLAVVGFDNMPESAFFYPPLTTVQQQLVELGCTAVRELCRIIDAEEQDKPEILPGEIMLQPSLIVRESSVARRNEN